MAKSLALGLGQRTREALDRTLHLNPRHADAHLALATFHAEVIDKVGDVVGAVTYGASKHSALALYDRAAELNPGSLVGMLETARHHRGDRDKLIALAKQGSAQLEELFARERAARERPRRGAWDE